MATSMHVHAHVCVPATTHSARLEWHVIDKRSTCVCICHGFCMYVYTYICTRTYVRTSYMEFPCKMEIPFPPMACWWCMHDCDYLYPGCRGHRTHYYTHMDRNSHFPDQEPTRVEGWNLDHMNTQVSKHFVSVLAYMLINILDYPNSRLLEHFCLVPASCNLDHWGCNIQ